jgi:aminopeptidase N
MRILAGRFGEDLAAAFLGVDTYRAAVEPKDGIEERRLKAILLRVLIEAETPAVYGLAEEHFHRAWNFSDKAAALGAIGQSDHPRRRALLDEAFGLWSHHLNGYTTYLGLVASGRDEDTFDAMAREERRGQFRLDHPNHTRALYLSMAANNKLLWTERGLDWAVETAVRLSRAGEHTALRLVDAFRLAHGLGPDLKPPVLGALRRILDGIDAAQCPSLAGRVRTYLDGPFSC